jgi:membrane protein YdbS with pleckstrin-like domain
MKTEAILKKLISPEKIKPELEPDPILTAEFGYIVQSAFQANEDRARVTSFYLVSVGSFIAAILGTQLLAEPQPVVYWSFGALFLFLAVLAVMTILQLVRLRRAWFESILAMNQIKDFYTRNVQRLNLADAFRWQTPTIPKMDKPNSLSFYLAIEVGLFGAAAFGAAYYFILLGFGWISWGPAIVLAALFLAGELFLYRRLLK